jgi:hypothetical protein
MWFLAEPLLSGEERVDATVPEIVEETGLPSYGDNLRTLCVKDVRVPVLPDSKVQLAKRD